MDTTQKIVLIGHTFVAIMIIVLVLMQRGKGADAGAAFGSGASGTVFGARGSSSFFSRATAVLATTFFASSLALAYMSSQRVDEPRSLIDTAAPVETESAEPLEPAAEDAALPVLRENLPDEFDQPPGELPELETEPREGDPDRTTE